MRMRKRKNKMRTLEYKRGGYFFFWLEYIAFGLREGPCWLYVVAPPVWPCLQLLSPSSYWFQLVQSAFS